MGKPQHSFTLGDGGAFAVGADGSLAAGAAGFFLVSSARAPGPGPGRSMKQSTAAAPVRRTVRERGRMASSITSLDAPVVDQGFFGRSAADRGQSSWNPAVDCAGFGGSAGI